MQAQFGFKLLSIHLLFSLACGTEAYAASCVAPPLSLQKITQFQSNPQAIVAPNSDTRTIEASVRDLAGTDASLATSLIKVAQATDGRFRNAIAAGLAQAATACSTIDPPSALLIQQAVAQFPDGEFQNVFAAVAGDLSTAATDAAAQSATGSAGSVTVTNPNGFQAPSTSTGSAGTPLLFQITSAGISLNQNSANTITTTLITPATTTSTAATPVSPTR